LNHSHTYTYQTTVSHPSSARSHHNENLKSHTLYCPTNAHNVKNVELLKQFKIREAAF